VTQVDKAVRVTTPAALFSWPVRESGRSSVHEGVRIRQRLMHGLYGNVGGLEGR